MSFCQFLELSVNHRRKLTWNERGEEKRKRLIRSVEVHFTRLLSDESVVKATTGCQMEFETWNSRRNDWISIQLQLAWYIWINFKFDLNSPNRKVVALKSNVSEALGGTQYWNDSLSIEQRRRRRRRRLKQSALCHASVSQIVCWYAITHRPPSATVQANALQCTIIDLVSRMHSFFGRPAISRFFVCCSSHCECCFRFCLFCQDYRVVHTCNNSSNSRNRNNATRSSVCGGNHRN